MGETVFDQQPDSTTKPAVAPTQAPVTGNATGTVFDNTNPAPASGTTTPAAAAAPSGEIRARDLSSPFDFRSPGALSDTAERVMNMFREPARSRRGDAYYRDNPDKQHSGFIAPEEFMSESEKHEHPMATAIGEEIGGMTSPENILMLIATEGLGAATPFLRGGLKIAPRLVSAGFSGQMLYGAYKQFPQFKAALEAGDESEAERILTHIVLSGAMGVQAGQHAIKGTPIPTQTRPRTEVPVTDKTGAPESEASTVFGPRTKMRPTTVKTAGVEAPIAATQQPGGSAAARVANRFTTPGAAREFQKEQTLPAAQKQLTSAMGQVMEDAIATHQSIAEGKPMPDAVAGTQKVSKFQTLDEAAQAGERAAKVTWKKGDAVDAREMSEWQKQADEITKQVTEHNQLVDEHNANLSEGEDPMQPMDASKLIPEKPKTLADVRSEWTTAKANSRSNDPAVRQEAFDNQIPAAEKSMDKWFKQHPDDISQEEYQSVKRLTTQHERMQEISNKLRGPMDTGTLTGNKLRNIEATFNNRGAKYGRPNAFRDLLGSAGYENWRNIAKVLDPLKGPSSMERGVELFLTGFLGHLMPAGIAAKLGSEFILNRALFDPNWGKWFTKNYANFKLTGKATPNAQAELDRLMKSAKPTDEEAKKLGWSQEEIDKGEHLPPEPAKPKAYGESNVGVTKEEYQKAVESFNKQIMGGLKTGVPLPLGDMMTIGRYHLEAGAHAFTDWSSDMVSELGEKIRPYLDDIWTKVNTPSSQARSQSQAQFDAHAANGGSTFSPEGDDLGSSDAYAVSAYPTRTKTYSDAEWNPSRIDDYKAENSDLLEQEGHAVGTWKDTDNGLHTLDITRLIPNKDEAMAVGRSANQKAIYHLGRGELVDTGGTGEAGVQHVIADYNQKLGKPEVEDIKTPVNQELANQIADAYDQLKHDPNDPKVKRAYNALIAETKAQWKALEAAGYKLQPEDKDPYGLDSDIPAYDEMAKDVRENRRIKVWTGGQPPADHPLSKIDPETGVSYNTLFRAVHDIMGHVAGGNDFSQQGEENAYQRHAQSYSKKAVPALTTETRGQTSHFFNNEKVRGGASPDFVDQRAALLPSKFYATEQSHWARVIDHMKEKYGVTSDPLKAGFILPEGDMIPLAEEHDKMLGGKPTDNLRESFIKDTGAIRSRYRMSRAGEEQVFSLPKEITEKQARMIKAAAGKLRNGQIVLETVNGKSHSLIEFPTGAKVQEALDGMVRVKPEPESDVEVLDEPSDVNASGESAASQEAVGRVASEKAQGIKRVKVLKSGQEVPLVGVDAVDARAGKGETIVKRYADGHEEIQDQGQGANYAGPKAPMSAERSKGDTEFFQQAKKSMPDATMSQQLQEAERLRREALPKDNTASEIPTRSPRGKNLSTALNPDQHVNLDAMKLADNASPTGTTADGRPKMGYMEKMARTIAAYTGVNYGEEELKNPDAVVSKFINHVAGNLEWLYNQVPPEIRDRTKLWYDSANKNNAQLAKQYGVTPEQAAGITAALSPQNPWDNNVALAKVMMDAWANRQNVKMTPEMEKKAIDIVGINPAFKSLVKQIKGKTLSEIKLPDTDKNPDAKAAEAVLKGLWIRLFDEAHGNKINDEYRPDGTIAGPSSMARSWIGLDHLAKSVRILEDGSLENINGVMGNGHKIRNFYNNIINPNSAKGHVTIDTHAVAAAHMQPFGTDSTEAAHNFGGGTKGVPGAPQSAPVGLKGTYPVYAEAYRRVAAKLGIHPRELQSITWEAIKSLMGDEKKTPELKAKAKEIWLDVQNGKLTPEQARVRIKEESGGFSKPGWMSDEEWEKQGSEAGDTDFDFGGGEMGEAKTSGGISNPEEITSRTSDPKESVAVLVSPDGKAHAYTGYDPSGEMYTHSSLFNKLLVNEAHEKYHRSTYGDGNGKQSYGDMLESTRFAEYLADGGIRASTEDAKTGNIEISKLDPAVINRALEVAKHLNRPTINFEYTHPKTFKVEFNAKGTPDEVAREVQAWERRGYSGSTHAPGFDPSFLGGRDQ